MVLDVILQARDRGLFHAITDCGAGGFSSAVGEMGAELGAVGRSRARSAQVPGALVHRDLDLRGPGTDGAGRPAREMAGTQASSATARRSRRPTWASSSTPAGSSCAITARSSPTCRWSSCTKAGPRSSAQASFDAPARAGRCELPAARRFHGRPAGTAGTLGRLQQGMDRPPVRPRGPGPDRHQAAGRLVRRRAGRRGRHLAGPRLVPRPGRRLRHQPALWPARPLSPWRPASSTRPIRNCVAVGADPRRIALLDNFCWGNTERPETLGSLVLAAQACHDLALAYGTPFISGKDSLNNEYTHEGKSLAIPADALDQRDRPGARRPPLRDHGFQGAGQLLVLLVGMTRHELGGSLWAASARAGRRQRARRRPRSRSAGCSGPSTGDQPRAGPELPRPERRRPWPSPWPRWPSPAAWGRPSRSATSRARTTPRTTSCSCSPSHPRRFLLEVPPEHHAALADLLGTPAVGPPGRGRFQPDRERRPRRG